MSQDRTRRGIFYSVRRMSEQRWKWEIDPPQCIKGLYAESGEIEGRRIDAVSAAQKAIEAQTQQFTH